MITAKQFAAQNTIWHKATPALEQFTRWTNLNADQFSARQVPKYSDPDRRSFLAEIAFEALARGSSVRSPDVQAAAREQLALLPSADRNANDLAAHEESEASELQERLSFFLEHYTEGGPCFRPELLGCGTVQSTQADILVGNHLIEVKAVERNFRGSDFRQVLTYAALATSNGIEVRRITVLNPRLLRHYTSQSEGLALDIGAGSWVELMQDLANSMTADPNGSGL